MTDLTELTIAEAATLLKERTLSPIDLTEAYLDRIARLDGAYNAYITVTRDRALSDAERARSEIATGNYRGPLHGIPIGLKDIVSTEGILTTCGSKILAEWVPDEDAGVARKLSEAGSVLLGKLNTHEFAMGATNNNPHYGPAHNPWDLTKVSGGSSGGSGVATAAHLAMGAIGTDTGGSIRIPAALCGCVGFKATYGRVSKAGIFPLSSMLDHAGPLTRTVEDSALMLQAIAGYDPDDPNSALVPVGDYTATLKDGIAGLRIGVPAGPFAEVPTSEVRAAIEEALAVLAVLGAEIVPVVMDLPADPMRSMAMLSVEARHYHARHIEERLGDYGADLQKRFVMPDPGRDAIGEAMATTEAIRREFQRALTKVDLLVTPTTPTPAPTIGAETFTLDGREYTDMDLARLTAPMNQARLPALTVPCGFSVEGMPIGLSFTGRAWEEPLVLRAGYAYEQATDWHTRRPAGAA